MNILLFNFEYPPLGGGGGVMTSQIAEELATRHTVHVITTRYRSVPSYEFLHGVHVHRVPVFGRTSMPTATFLSLITYAPSAFFRGLILTRKHAFDIINAHFIVPSGLPAFCISKIRNIPIVITLIGGDVYDPSKGVSPHRHSLFRWIIRTMASNADALTAISHDTKQRAIELHGITKHIEVVPIGLRHGAVSAISRESLGIGREDFLCVSIGRLVPRKGYDVLLKAWRHIPNAHLIIMGNGPQKEYLNSLLVAYSLTKRVHMVGYVPEDQKLGILQNANVYVSAAQHEGFGLVFLEAMDAGLPIIAANDGGQKDFLEHGKNALLIPPLDAEKIAESLQKIIVDNDLRERMKKQNSKDVKKYYIDKTVQLLEQVLINTSKKYEHHS